jgi:hypothetical protein
MKIEIIIQDTTAGLNNQFVSQSIDITNDSVKASLKLDERMFASHIANHSTVYSVQVINLTKVYSAIYTNISDVFGRSGYYAIKLYTKHNYAVSNILDVFDSINEAYLNFKKANQLNNQNYDAILSDAQIIAEKDFICSVNSQIHFTYYITRENVIEYINNSIVSSINKLYIFDKTRSREATDIVQSGLAKFDDYKGLLECFEVDNTHRVLQSLYINNETILRNNFPDRFWSYKKKGDIVSYVTTDDSNKRTGNTNNGVLRVNRKESQPIIRSHSDSPTKGREIFELYVAPAIALFSILLIGGAMYYFFFYDNELPAEQAQVITKKEVNPNKPAPQQKDSSAKVLSPGKYFITSDKKYFKLTKPGFEDRTFFEKQGTCYVKNTIRNESEIPVTKQYIGNTLKVNADKIDAFVKDLSEFCGCSIVQNTNNNKGNKDNKDSLNKKNEDKSAKPQDIIISNPFKSK